MQETTQLFKRPKKIRNYFPMYAKHKNEILQMDLMDVSDIAKANDNYRLMLVSVDVFTSLAFVVPLKNKETSNIIKAVEEVLDITEPTIVNCDNGSEFISNAFKKIVKERGIDVRFADVKDHHKLAIVDRFCRT